MGAAVAALACLAGAFNAAIVYLPSGQSRAAGFLTPLVGVVVTVAMFLAARLLARQLGDRYGTGTVERADRRERRRVASQDVRGGQVFVFALLVGLMVWCALAAFAATPEEHPAQRVGDSISIRVDPSQPDYAELPGQPSR